MAPAGLAIHRLMKSFGANRVLDGLDLDVSEGCVTAVLGPSGSGKTTLLRLIAGFERADHGTIQLGDAIVSKPGVHVPPERRGVGVVSQEGSLFPHLDVSANVGFGLPRNERQSGRIQELLSLVGLVGFERRYPHELSGGEQQRVALARALAPRPRIILLDEPFSALDPSLRTTLREQVRAALKAAGTTALLVTHDQFEALSIADQVAVMRGGRIAQMGEPRTVYGKPVDADVACFVGEAVLLPGTVDDGFVQCALGRLQVDDPPAIGGPAVAMLRPEQLVLNGDSGELFARVIGITYHGHDAMVRLVVVMNGGLALVARVPGHSLPSPGQLVSVSVSGPVRAYPCTTGRHEESPGEE